MQRGGWVDGLAHVSKAAVLALCAYESAAITTGRVPTVTHLCRRYWLVEASVIALLLAHLHVEQHIIDRLTAEVTEDAELLLQVR